VTVQPLFIQVNYVYRAGGTGPLQPIRQGQALRSGDHYKIYFSPSRDCYVYIYQIDAAGQIFRLFPLITYNGVALNHDNPVKGGDPITLPSDDRYFYLDQTVGREMLFFAASTHRMTALENLQKEMNIALTSRDSERIEAVRNEITAYLNNPARGRTPSAQVSPITWQTGETTFSVAGYLLEFIDRENIHTVSFNHR
jgi:hypothetical protein